VLVGGEVFWVRDILVFDVGVVERWRFLVDWRRLELLHRVGRDGGHVLDLWH